ncbi:hypothetical protein FBG20_06245 [Escherichia coli]|nr:hypothetical protein [Escherichia coli]
MLFPIIMSWTPLASSVSESYTRKMTKRKTPRHFCPGVCLFLRGAGQLHHAAHATHAAHTASSA